MATRSEVPLPATARRRNALEECHIVDSTWLPPILISDDQSRSDTFEPTTVTLQLPVDCPFVGCIELGPGAAYDSCIDRLPTCSPVVTVIDRAERMPKADLATTPLSDTHAVISMSLPPIRLKALYAQWPVAPWPTTVTLTLPVMATLVSATLLAVTPSYVTDATRLPTINAVVVDSDRAVQIPEAALSVKLLPDDHCVAVTMLPLRRAIDVRCQVLAPEPTTVTLIAAVVAMLAGVPELTT